MIKFLRLKFLLSNLRQIAFLLMLWITILGPGYVTLIYPFTIFGYAALFENGPGMIYWYLIAFYTQVLTMGEFIISLNSTTNWFDKYKSGKRIRNTLNEMYLGI